MSCGQTMDFVYEAAKQARKSPCDMKHGAVIVLRNEIVAKGYNYYPEICDMSKRKFKLSVHAERAAIQKFLRCYRRTELKNTTLYVVRLGKDDTLRNSKPCRHCARVIQKYELAKTYYSTEMTNF